MVWLPSREDDNRGIKCGREFCCSNRELPEGGYDHPVVVLKVSPNNLGDEACSMIQVRHPYYVETPPPQRNSVLSQPTTVHPRLEMIDMPSDVWISSCNDIAA
jgi:hypothetical protein